MKTGKCNTEYAAYYLDQYWKQNPGATVRNHHTLSNHDFFISKRAFFFDLSPWGDEPATDEPTQKVGTDLATLKEMLLLAYQQNKGEKYCYIGNRSVGKCLFLAAFPFGGTVFATVGYS